MPPDETPDVTVHAAIETGEERSDAVRKRVDGLANAIRSLHYRDKRGELASLRRMDEGTAVEPAFQQILAGVAPTAYLDRNDRLGRPRYDDARRLALMTKILALPMSRDGLADGYGNLGEAMAAAKVSERRVQALMTARGAALDDLVLRMARLLVRAGMLPFLDIGRLLLGTTTSVENTRFRIAKGYWGNRREAADSDVANKDTAGGDIE